MGRHHPHTNNPKRASQGPTQHGKIEWPTVDEDAPEKASRWFTKPLDKRKKTR